MTALLWLALQAPLAAPSLPAVEPQHTQGQEAGQGVRPWFVEWGLRGPGLVRFTRVEGLSLGAHAGLLGARARWEGVVRLGYGDWTPNAGLRVRSADSRLGGAIHLYSALRPTDPQSDALSIGHTLRAALLGRDDAEYVRASGIELSWRGRGTDRVPWSVGVYGEAQRRVFRETRSSLRSVLGGDPLRPVIPAAAAEQIGIRVRGRPVWGADPTRPHARLDALLQAETGTWTLVRGSAIASGGVPLGGAVSGAAQVRAALVRGDRPPQAMWYAGGSATARGYAGSSRTGATLLAARVEVATALQPGALVLFGDAAWAGDDLDVPLLDRALVSAGVGLSLLDGVLRLDLARRLRFGPGWEADLSFRALR